MRNKTKQKDKHLILRENSFPPTLPGSASDSSLSISLSPHLHSRHLLLCCWCRFYTVPSGRHWVAHKVVVSAVSLRHSLLHRPQCFWALSWSRMGHFLLLWPFRSFLFLVCHCTSQPFFSVPSHPSIIFARFKICLPKGSPVIRSGSIAELTGTVFSTEQLLVCPHRAIPWSAPPLSKQPTPSSTSCVTEQTCASLFHD